MKYLITVMYLKNQSKKGEEPFLVCTAVSQDTDIVYKAKKEAVEAFFEKYQDIMTDEGRTKSDFLSGRLGKNKVFFTVNQYPGE